MMYSKVDMPADHGKLTDIVVIYLYIPRTVVFSCILSLNPEPRLLVIFIVKIGSSIQHQVLVKLMARYNYFDYVVHYQNMSPI